MNQIRHIVESLETVKDIIMEQDNAVTPALIDALDYAIEAVIKNKNRRGRKPRNPFEQLDYFFDEFLGGRR